MEKKKLSKCKIDEIIINNSYDQKPALINFDEGVLLKERANHFKCSLVEDSEDENEKEEDVNMERQTMVLLGDNDEKFVGKVMPKETTLRRTMIMIRNKDSNKLRLIEVDQYNVMKVIDKVDDSDDDSDASENLYETNRHRLYRMFGSKKSNRILDLGKKSKVNTSIMKMQMEKTAASMTINPEDLEVTDGNVEIYLPKCNRETTQVEEVYSLEDMLSPEELESLDEVTERVLSDPPTESPEGSEFSSFFVGALKYLGKKRTPDHIKSLLYADAILYFLKLNMHNLKRKKIYSSVCPFSKAISEKIFEEFTVQTENGRLRPEQMTDKAVCWIIVLTLIACKYTLDITLLCPHLLNRELDSRRFEKFLKILGLKSVSSGYWILTAPLNKLVTKKEGLIRRKKKMFK